MRMASVRRNVVRAVHARTRRRQAGVDLESNRRAARVDESHLRIHPFPRRQEARRSLCAAKI